MELRQYFYLVLKWLWMLILGTVAGAVVAYGMALTQPLVYQAKTKVMVSRAPDQTISDYSIYSDLQLAKSYVELIVTQPVIDATSEKMGFKVSKGQVSVRQIPDTLLLEITVKDGNPGSAMLVANSIIEVFTDYNESLQNTRFVAAEESLQRQITQVETQISDLQNEIAQASAESLQEQQARIEEQLNSLEGEIRSLRTQIDGQEDSPQKSDLQDQLDQLETRYGLYQKLYEEIVVLGSSSSSSSNPSLRQMQLQTTLSLYQQIYANLLNNYESVRLSRLRSTSNVVQVEPATLPGAPISPQPVRNAMLGAAVGLMLMAGLAFLIEYLDDTIKTPDDIGRLFNLPVIGLIGEIYPKEDGTGTHVSVQPRSPVTEAFRSLRTNLEFASVDKPLKKLLITSSEPSEGKTTVAANLAAILAQGERKVVLLDCDLRRPSIQRYVKGGKNRTGLTDMFRLPSIDPSVWYSPEIKYSIITSGELPPNPSELLESERMTKILDYLASKNDNVIIDSSPAIVSDPIILSTKVDGVLVVVEPGKSKIDPVRAMIEQLQRAGARIVGVVFNPIARKKSGYYAGRYRYYSGHYDYDHSEGYYGQSESHKSPNRAKALGKRNATKVNKSAGV
jgi:succinoglycan biosynthesis transport protein ExoP